MNNSFKEGFVEVDGRELRLTNLDKPLWPEEGYTKGDLIYYYFRIADYLLPHLKDRPLTLKRYPNGVKGRPFFQKNADPQTPAWVQTEQIFSESTNEYINYIFCNDKATLIYLANLAVVSQNPWLSHRPALDNPDFVVLDIDPQGSAAFSQAVEVSLLAKEQLDKFGLISLVKTSGATGIHIFIPVKPVYSYKQTRTFAELIATIVTRQNSHLATIEHSVAQRGNKIYIDYLQNIQSKTIASVYSVRARPGAPVSTPLMWHELENIKSPTEFNMFNIFKRLEEKGDIFKGVLETPQDLSNTLLKNDF